jgi:hypothetical protein
MIKKEIPCLRDAKIPDRKLASQKIFTCDKYPVTSQKIAELLYIGQSTSTRLGTLLPVLFFGEVNIPESSKHHHLHINVNDIDFTKTSSYPEVVFSQDDFKDFGLLRNINLDNITVITHNNDIDVYCLELTRGTRHNTRASQGWMDMKKQYDEIMSKCILNKYPKTLNFNLSCKYVPFDLDDLANLQFHEKMTLEEKRKMFITGIDICKIIGKPNSHQQILKILESKNEDNVDVFLDKLIEIQNISENEKK